MGGMFIGTTFTWTLTLNMSMNYWNLLIQDKELGKTREWYQSMDLDPKGKPPSVLN